jgi:hypothetical protein
MKMQKYLIFCYLYLLEINVVVFLIKMRELLKVKQKLLKKVVDKSIIAIREIMEKVRFLLLERQHNLFLFSLFLSKKYHMKMIL